jgi:hypothetical protein
MKTRINADEEFCDTILFSDSCIPFLVLNNWGNQRDIYKELQIEHMAMSNIKNNTGDGHIVAFTFVLFYFSPCFPLPPNLAPAWVNISAGGITTEIFEASFSTLIWILRDYLQVSYHFLPSFLPYFLSVHNHFALLDSCNELCSWCFLPNEAIILVAEPEDSTLP